VRLAGQVPDLTRDITGIWKLNFDETL
jgi:hypothetical protein